MRLVGLILALLPLAAAAEGVPAIAAFDAASAPVLNDPRDLALGPDGRLYIADTGGHRIAVMDPGTLGLTGTIGAGELVAPHDVSFGPDGLLYVADTGRSRVAVFRLDGPGAVFVRSLADGIPVPEGVLAHPDGTVYVTSTGAGMIVAFRDGVPVFAARGLFRPHDVVADGDGNVWVADTGNARFVRFSPGLEVLGVIDDLVLGLAGPRYMALTEAGHILAADKSAGRVKLISPDGKLVAMLGKEDDAEPTRFSRPNGVETEGALFWFADAGTGRILRYRLVLN